MVQFSSRVGLLLVGFLSLLPSSLSLQRSDASIEITPSSNIQPIANGDTTIGQSQQPILGEFNEREPELNANPGPGEWSQSDGIAEEETMTNESNIDGTIPTDQDGNPTSSQPLQTLKKLQQMLDETDYMTTKSANSRGDDNNFPLPTSPSNHQQHQNHNQQRQHPFVATATPASKPEENTARDPIPPDHPFNHKRVDPPPELPPQYLYQQDLDANGPQNAQQPIMLEKDLDLPPAHPYQSQQPPPTPDEPTTSSNVGAVQVTNNQQQRQTQPPAPQQNINQEQDAVRPLWTSKDRSKYKKMQQMQRRADEERRRLEQQLLIQPGSSSDDEQDGMTDTDDGLGYTLPNLPVYMSDAEGESSDSGEALQAPTIIPPSQHQLQQQPLVAPPLSSWGYNNQPRPDLYLPQQQQQQHQYGYPNSNGQQFPPPNHQQQPADPFVGSYGPGYPPYMPYYTSQQQLQQQQPYSNVQQPQQQQPYANLPQGQQQQQQPLYSNPQLQQQQMLATQYSAAWGYPQQRLQVPPSHAHAATIVAETIASPYEPQQLVVIPEVPTTLAEATSRINFDSIQKLSLLFVSVATLAYSAVSPRNLQPLSEYNRHFYDNLRLVALCTIVPMANFLLVCDARENDINSVITSFYTSFTVGYALAFVLEILMTTAVRLGVFVIWERNIFKLSPKVPTLVLPWVLRENKYRPKRITLFAADFLSSCVASPIIEEYVKLKILQLSVRLPRNFNWLTKVSTTGKNSKKKRKRRVAEAATKNPGDQDVTNINSYVTHMLAVSLGMKLCDSSRRILMYTKKGHSNKSLYAFLRGAFPIQELCGTMTALALAKRDVLGVNMAQWQMLVPAVLIHGMANLRGMKPLFKWNSATPWSEMQLSPWNAADDSTLPQLINKGFAKLMWLVLLGRVLGYCIKNYYLVSRQARKRTTTYAGKQAAFSAELAAAEMLKKTKDKK